jgi:hypothetical protein
MSPLILKVVSCKPKGTHTRQQFNIYTSQRDRGKQVRHRHCTACKISLQKSIILKVDQQEVQVNCCTPGCKAGKLTPISPRTSKSCCLLGWCSPQLLHNGRSACQLLDRSFITVRVCGVHALIEHLCTNFSRQCCCASCFLSRPASVCLCPC